MGFALNEAIEKMSFVRGISRRTQDVGFQVFNCQKLGLTSAATVTSRRFFAVEVTPQMKQTIIDAVKSFNEMRKHDLSAELTQKGADASETEKKNAEEMVKKLNAAVTETSQWRDFGFDGLDEVECVLTIEDALGVRLPDEEFHAIHGVPDAIQVIAKHGSKEATA